MGFDSPHTQSVAEQLAKVIASQQVEVPVLPDVTHQVLSLTQDSDSDASQLAKIIQSDPTMGGHVIRIANSAAYTPNSNLVSLQQAITRLGMVEISNIAISTSLNTKMFKAPGYEKHIDAIWQHSLFTAAWAKEVSRTLRKNVEAAFLCGLLHSIAKAVILQTIADLAEKGDSPISDGDLKQLFSEYESQVSQVVANEWGLPEIVAEAITYYNNFQDAPSCAEIAATVLFGSQLAHHTIDPESFSLEALSESPALELINLYPDEVQALLEKSDAIKSSVQALLS